MGIAGRVLRAFRHAGCGAWTARRHFPAAVMDQIEARIAAGETSHSAEIRIAIEASIAPSAIWGGQTPRERALEVFGALRVWDTAGNNGVLVYVLLADRAVEIVADRAASAAIEPEVWSRACADMVSAYRDGRYATGTLEAVDRLNDALVRAFPAGEENRDELPNRPALI